VATATEATAIPAFAPGERVEEEDGLGVVGTDSGILVGVGVDVETVVELVPAMGSAAKLMGLLSQQAVLLLPQQNAVVSFGHGVTSTSFTLSFPSWMALVRMVP
jgi:hypothetical protein